MIRPSSLPMLAQCPKFEGNGGEYAEAGTNRHRALSELFSGVKDRDEILAPFTEEERDALLWAEEFIRLKAPMADHPLVFETKRQFVGGDFATYEGTPDVVCGNVVFDLKWRRRDYTAQMAAYSLMLQHEHVTVHVLYGEPKQVQTLTFTKEQAEEIVFPLIETAKAPNAQPKACDYCGWCRHALTCEALTKPATQIATGYADTDLQLAEWHPSKIQSPEDMAKALTVARVVAHWCESVEHHAREMAVTQGRTLPGFKLQSRQGNRFIPSIADAFVRSGLPQDKFLGACEVKFSKLVETYAAEKALKKAPAERELESKLGDAIQRKPSTQSLVAEKSNP